jgi:predicted P-loop ATPase
MAQLKPEVAVAAAKAYLDQGWAVFPLPIGEKKPGRDNYKGFKNWRDLAAAVTHDNVEKMFSGGENIGVLLNEPLVDIDLDSVEAVKTARYFLPNTPFTFGRSTSGHRVYLCPGIEFRAFSDPIAAKVNAAGDRDVKGMLLEIRTGGGHYTMFPPSVHPSGEQLAKGPKFGWPNQVVAEDLELKVRLTAASAMLARYWPGPGVRNEAIMCLCGGLVRAEADTKIQPEVSDRLVKCLVEVCEHGDPDTDFQALSRTRRKSDKDKNTKGWKSLATLLGTHGKEIVQYVRELLGIQTTASTGPTSALLQASFVDKILFEQTRQGPQPLPTAENISVIIQNDPELWLNSEEIGDGLFFDACAGMPRWAAGPVWDAKRNIAPTYPRDVNDVDATLMQGWLARRWAFKVSRDECHSAIDAVAMMNCISPVQRYLESLIWDQEPRLDTMAITHFNAPADHPNTKFYCTAVRKWMIAAVARALKPGCKMDNVIILEGPQGIGKSTALRELAGNDEWFTDSHINMQDKSGVEVLEGAWIIELGELASMRRSSIETVKEFVSRTFDKVRRPYARRVDLIPRRGVFAGSVNPDGTGYLKDPTGDRRFWPIECIGKLDIKKVIRDRDQLWAEAVAVYQSGEPWFLTDDMPEIADAAEKVQQSRRERHPLEGQLIGWLQDQAKLANKPRFQIPIMKFLIEGAGYSSQELGKSYLMTDMGKLMKTLGFERGGQVMYRFDRETATGRAQSQKFRSVAYWITTAQLYEITERDEEYEDVLRKDDHPNHPDHDEVPF